MRWSWSAHTTFRRCQRQHLFSQVIASHNARDPKRREAYLCKQLQQLPAWRGSLVHTAIERFVIPPLRAGRSLDVATVIRETTTLAERQLRFSQRRAFRELGMTKAKAGEQYAALMLHETDNDLSADDWQETLATIETCITHLAQRTEVLRAIQMARQVDTEHVLQYTLDNVTIIAKLDLLLTRVNGHSIIVDWKVSRADEDADYRQQVLIYALVATRRLGRPLDDMSFRAINLLSNTITPYVFGDDDLITIEDRIFRSITDMQDVEDGVAGATALALVDTIPPAQAITTCRYCAFRALCQEASRAQPHD